MSQEELTYWKTSDYLKGKLTGDDLIQFQQELKTNETLRNEVEMHQLANQLIVNNRLNSAKNISFEIQAKYKKELLIKKIAIGSLIGIAFLSSTILFFRTTDTKVEPAQKTKELPNNAVSKKEATASNEKHKTVMANAKNNTSITIKETEKIDLKPAVAIQSQTVETTINQTASSNSNSITPVASKEAAITAEVVDLCSKVTITALASGSTTCVGEENGSIIVSGYKGGKAPYKFEIFSTKEDAKMTNRHLASGKYNVHIFDQNNCEAIIENVMVKEIECNSKEAVFNPFLGETFTLPAYSTDGVFSVLDKTGAIYFKQNTLAKQELEWNGTSLNGETETGHFAYEVIYQDGTRKNGTLTITR